MPFELIRRMGIRTQNDLCVVAPSTLEELEDNIDSTLARAVLDCRKFEDTKPDNPTGAVQRLNENGFASIQNASIDDIGSFTLRGFNIAHLIVLGEITTYSLLDLRKSCPDSLRLLLETRSSNSLQLLPIELAALTDRHSAEPMVISANFYIDEFATSLFSQTLQAHCVLSIMNVVDVTRLLQLAIIRGNTFIIKYILSVYSQFGGGVSFRDLIITNDMHTLSAVNFDSLSYLMSSKLTTGEDTETPLCYAYDTCGMLPIHAAALNGRLSCVLWLLQYDKGMIDVLTKDTNINLLSCAISSNSIDCVSAIVHLIKEIGGETALRKQLQHRFGNLQTNALALAILYSNRDIVSLLIKHSIADDLLVTMLPLKVDDEPHMQLPLLHAFARGCSVIELLFYTEQYHNIYNFIISRSIAEKKMLFRAAEKFCKAKICGSMQMVYTASDKRSARRFMQQGCCMNSDLSCVCPNSLACKILTNTCSTYGIVLDCLSRYTGILLYAASLLGLGISILIELFLDQSTQLPIQTHTSKRVQNYMLFLLPSLRTLLEHRLYNFTLQIGSLVSVVFSALFFITTYALRLDRTASISLAKNDFMQSSRFSDDMWNSRRMIEEHTDAGTSTGTGTGTHTPDTSASCSAIMSAEPVYRICDVLVSRSLTRSANCLYTVEPRPPFDLSSDKENRQHLAGVLVSVKPNSALPEASHLCSTCLKPEQGTYCYFCSVCVCRRIFHSHIFNFCISQRNVCAYAISMGLFYSAWVLFLFRSPFHMSKIIMSLLVFLFSYLVLLDVRK